MGNCKWLMFKLLTIKVVPKGCSIKAPTIKKAMAANPVTAIIIKAEFHPNYWQNKALLVYQESGLMQRPFVYNL